MTSRTVLGQRIIGQRSPASGRSGVSHPQTVGRPPADRFIRERPRALLRDVDLGSLARRPDHRQADHRQAVTGQRIIGRRIIRKRSPGSGRSRV